MKKRILILGASRYYIRSIISARELGCEVTVTDRNPLSDGFKYADSYEVVDITDIEGSIEVARKYAIDGVVAINDFGVRTAAAIANELGLVGITPEAAQRATSKAFMRQKWWEDGVPSPRFMVVKTLDEAQVALEELNTFPLILKPADSRGGASRGVSRINSEDELPAALEFAQQFYEDKSVVIEEFLTGSEHSMETITYEGQTQLLAISDKVKTPLPYRVDKSVIYPTTLSAKEISDVHEVATKAVKSLGIDIGASHIEMCVTKDGPMLFELGARCGGGGTPDPIVPFLTGIEMFKETVRIAIGEEPHNLYPLYTKGCVYRFIIPKPGKVKKVVGLDEVKQWPGILDCEVFVKAGDEVRPVRVGGDRSGFVIAAGDNREEAIELADKAESYIRFEYED